MNKDKNQDKVSRINTDKAVREFAWRWLADNGHEEPDDFATTNEFWIMCEVVKAYNEDLIGGIKKILDSPYLAQARLDDIKEFLSNYNK